MKGRFITFEGPEKSGKSTQAKLLGAYLKKCGYKTLLIREPGATSIGEKVRDILLDKKNLEMTLSTEMLLYMAARSQLIEQVIRPALQKGVMVLCDRFLDSTIAYQGYGGGLDKEVIRRVGAFATGGIRPDLTILLDFWRSAEHLKNHGAPDRIEMRSEAYHRRVKKGYFALARREPRRIKIVRVAESRQETQRMIREIVGQCLLKRSSAIIRPSHS
jgi:dTMP kinase